MDTEDKFTKEQLELGEKIRRVGKTIEELLKKEGLTMVINQRIRIVPNNKEE